MGHHLSGDAVVVNIGIAEPTDARVTPRTTSVSDQARVRAQGGNPRTLVWQGRDVGSAHERPQIAPAAGRERFAIPHAEIISDDPAARQIEFFMAKLMILVQII